MRYFFDRFQYSFPYDVLVADPEHQLTLRGSHGARSGVLEIVIDQERGETVLRLLTPGSSKASRAWRGRSTAWQGVCHPTPERKNRTILLGAQLAGSHVPVHLPSVPLHQSSTSVTGAAIVPGQLITLLLLGLTGPKSVTAAPLMHRIIPSHCERPIMVT
ncbi:MAG: hypothetical protein ACRD44_18270 [Bryobacteraceae bacterium]